MTCFGEFHCHQAPGHHHLIRRCTGSRCLWCCLFSSVVGWPRADIPTFGTFGGAQAGREILGGCRAFDSFLSCAPLHFCLVVCPKLPFTTLTGLLQLVARVASHHNIILAALHLLTISATIDMADQAHRSQSGELSMGASASAPTNAKPANSTLQCSTSTTGPVQRSTTIYNPSPEQCTWRRSDQDRAGL